MRKTSWVCRVLVVILCLTGIGYAIPALLTGDWYEVLIRLSIILTAFLPTLFRRIFHLSFPPMTEIFYLLFIFFGHFLGSIVGLYNIVGGYDKVVHGFSGILTSIFALVLLQNLKLYHSKHFIFNIIFMISFSLAIAGIWEIFEYLSDCFFQANAQHALETGVNDTMMDMIVAFVGSIIFSAFYVYDVKEHKRGIVYHLVEE